MEKQLAPNRKKSPMIRKIVMLNEHEWLQDSFQQKSMSIAMNQLDQRISTQGFAFSSTGYPIRIGEQGYAVPAAFESEEAVDRLQEENPIDVDSVFADVQISTFAPVCPSNAVGTDADVKTKLNLSSLEAANVKGTGVRIMVVDGGIDGSLINVVGGYSPKPGAAPGSTSPPGHGTMVAYDALIAAPNAMIFDYAMLQSNGTTWVGLISDAIRAFAEILIEHLHNPGPMVVVNSWGMYDTSDDAPQGNPQNYSKNPSHPFNRLTASLVQSGIDVVFAAGNCGSTCPSSKCGANDIGPGMSILGANSHPDVTTVGAVTVNDEVLGYSSEGPGALSQLKPDLAGYSHFFGSNVNPIDDGTSAACPVVAGVIAALRSTPSGRNLTTAAMKSLVTDHARKIVGPTWDPLSGNGVVDAGACFAAISP